jgi:RNA polymerase sigma factor (sigma-70 family)
MLNTQPSVFRNDDINSSMTNRLMTGATRARRALSEGSDLDSAYVLRPDQRGVFEDLVEYLVDASNRTAADALPMGRIVLPSRTGKTVVAGKFIGECGLTATFIVPSKTLLEQAVNDIANQFPAVPVGYYYGDGKKLVSAGVNVITYQSLIGLWSSGKKLPEPLASSALVFADEGHMAMTARRLNVIMRGFDPRVPRIAMTATPDYNFERALGRFFPDLIHELSLAEAMKLDLLAPVRTWVYEVNVDASKVRMVAGNYDEAEIGEIMSAAPFFEMTNVLRYHPDNIDRSALICCSSRWQAKKLLAYLGKHRPQDRPMPVVIDKDTSRTARRAAMDGYERGEIDTIINVRAMLLGWNSPRCKLLIDLAPSTSHVLAMQKYFRPMTKWGNRTARIYLLVPSKLPKVPLLPIDFFLFGGGVYESGELIASSNQIKDKTEERAALSHKVASVAGVTLKSRIVIAQKFESPKLDPNNREAVKAVCLSNSAIKPEKICGYQRFRWLYFNHELFKGHGWQLLRFLGVASDKHEYLAFMAKMFAEAAGDRFFEVAGMTAEERRQAREVSCENDAEYLIQRIGVRDILLDGQWRSMQQGSRALFGSDYPSPEEIAIGQEFRRNLLECLQFLRPQEEGVLRLAFGIGGEELTYGEIAERYEVCRERIRQIVEKALRSLRHPARSSRFKGFLEP